MTFDYNKYVKDSNFLEVVKKLSEKNHNILEKIPEEEKIYIVTEDDARLSVHGIDSMKFGLTVLDLYNSYVLSETHSIFKEEIELLKQNKCLVRAQYAFIHPNSILEDHYDDDDTEVYRIMIGVHCPSNDLNLVHFTNKDTNETKNLAAGEALGIDISKELHCGKNLTDEYWSMLLISINKRCYGI